VTAVSPARVGIGVLGWRDRSPGRQPRIGLEDVPELLVAICDHRGDVVPRGCAALEARTFPLGRRDRPTHFFCSSSDVSACVGSRSRAAADAFKGAFPHLVRSRSIEELLDEPPAAPGGRQNIGCLMRQLQTDKTAPANNDTHAAASPRPAPFNRPASTNPMDLLQGTPVTNAASFADIASFAAMPRNPSQGYGKYM